MPYLSQFTQPEVFLTHKNLPVFRTYKDDEVINGEQTFSFTLDATRGFDTICQFDVRELPTWHPPEHPPYLSGTMSDAERAARNAAWKRYHTDRVEEQAIAAAIREAIDSGALQPYRCPVSWCEAIVPEHELDADHLCPECRQQACHPWTPPTPDTSERIQSFPVTLEYKVQAESATQAVEMLTAAIREAKATATLIRTDVRARSEVDNQ